jgi:hypothetical protein
MVESKVFSMIIWFTRSSKFKLFQGVTIATLCPRSTNSLAIGGIVSVEDLAANGM